MTPKTLALFIIVIIVLSSLIVWFGEQDKIGETMEEFVYRKIERFTVQGSSVDEDTQIVIEKLGNQGNFSRVYMYPKRD